MKEHLYYECQECGSNETVSVAQLQYEPTDTLTRACDYCEMELCATCFGEHHC